MHHYRYKLISAEGVVSTGVAKLPFDDPLAAISHLERDGGTTFYVKKLSPLASFFINFRLLPQRKKISRTAQAEFYSNLAMMLRAGMTLTAALEEVAGSMDRQGSANEFENMVYRIQGGETFSEVAAAYKHFFPETVIQLIAIGEETGRLDEVLLNAAEHLKRVQAIASDTKQALMYPSFVIAMIGFGFIFWAYYVAPKILDLFKEMDVALPALTVMVMNFSRFMQNYILHILAALAATVCSVFIGRKRHKGFRKYLDGLLIKLPVVGTIVSSSAMAFITEYFAMMMNAGIDVLNLMNILKKSVGNEIYREKLTEIRDDLTKGDSIAAAFKSGSLFPSYVTRMISVGEKSGTLSEQMAYIAEEYQRKLSVLVATIGKTIEPAVLVIAGLLFAVMIGGLMLPVYDLVGQVGQ